MSGKGAPPPPAIANVVVLVPNAPPREAKAKLAEKEKLVEGKNKGAPEPAVEAKRDDVKKENKPKSRVFLRSKL